jgi:hypothetical protein
MVPFPFHFAALHCTVKFETTEPLPQAKQPILPIASNEGSSKNISSASKSRASSAISKQQSRKLLGELFVDKEYLEKLLKHPGMYQTRILLDYKSL